MFEQLKKEVHAANKLLPEYGLVTLTWGNVSGIDREAGVIAIKPSGMTYDEITPGDIVVVELKTGKVCDGKRRSSSDTEIHLGLYRNFPEIGGITHTHSRWATIFAQSNRAIPSLGTTHADYFHGKIPCTRLMTAEEINGNYEHETGKVIAEACKNPYCIPAVLVAGHGPFTWGKNAGESVENALVLEEIAFMAWHDLQMQPDISPMQQELLDKHYKRKHGKDAYYGQS